MSNGNAQQQTAARGQSANPSLSPDQLKDLCYQLRREVLTMTSEAGSGHPSSSFSMTELIAELYFGGFLRYDPKQPHWPDRDRFILSKGHASPILYAVLANAGYFPTSELNTLRKIDSPLEGHPNMRRLPGVEASTGSLGQGLSIGLGHALAARIDKRSYNVFVMMGDGEIEEGQVWEAAMAASHQKVGNLIGILDNNKFQQTTPVTGLTDPTLYNERWRSFGWRVVEIDGHDLREIREAYQQAIDYDEGPFMIIAHTIKGKGLEFMEKDFTWHGRAVPKDKLAAALEELR